MATGSNIRRRTWLGEAWDSTLGKKLFAAGSAAVLVAYLLLHMLGNLTALGGVGDGSPQIDRYGEWLREFGTPLLPHAGFLWFVRGILLIAIAVHVTAVVQLARRNRAARPTGHGAKRIGRSWAARSMIVTGPLLIGFIVFHILHFTTLTVDVTPLRHGEVYANLYGAFQKWYFVLIYLVGVFLIGTHLRHGLWSMLQTLGLDDHRRRERAKAGATVVAGVLVAGFALIPILFWTGALPEPAGSAHATVHALSALTARI
ncbi:MAG: succinate dehydrogenase cytochrome b subunit [Patulibacter sp.]|nr:succinate dehydrogenase cytochrome b subunit [Patulibacter sp.]